MEKIIGIIIIFAAGYLMFRLQAGAGGCCGTGHHDPGSGQCGCVNDARSEPQVESEPVRSHCCSPGAVGTGETGNNKE
jgi:hypothetical protein